MKILNKNKQIYNNPYNNNNDKTNDGNTKNNKFKKI